jgi:RNA polymerase sigma-70 factor (ECF subfamily)
MTLSDAELLILAVGGDEGAFTALYRRHQGPVYRFALLMSGSTTIAEDVTQEVFMVLIREGARYDSSRGSLPAFLCGVARNYVLRVLERERPYIQLVEESEYIDSIAAPIMAAGNDPLSSYSRNEIARVVRQAVLSLPVRYREVVVLCDFQEMSYAEAAEVLGCAIGTINSRLHRSHALLLKKLRAFCESKSASSHTQGLRCFA